MREELEGERALGIGPVDGMSPGLLRIKIECWDDVGERMDSSIIVVDGQPFRCI